jgi:hypothetical protein
MEAKNNPRIRGGRVKVPGNQSMGCHVGFKKILSSSIFLLSQHPFHDFFFIDFLKCVFDILIFEIGKKLELMDTHSHSS